jgi:hypothetical protein
MLAFLSNTPGNIDLLVVPFWFGSGAIIGAGLLLPFKRPLTGAFFGLVIQALTAYWVVSRFG